jgi:hypothetical protein
MRSRVEEENIGGGCKRIKMRTYIETGDSIHTSLCFSKGCTTRLLWEACEGGTIHDGADFWLEDCKCHEEDKKRYCSKCRETAVCEECYISSSE